MTVTWNAEEIERRVRAGAMQGVTSGAYMVHEKGTLLIQDPPKTGKVYSRKGGVKHQASAPGEAPAGESGRLAGSGDVYLRPAEVAATINWSTDYAETLEKGGRSYGSVLAQHAMRTYQTGKMPSHNALKTREMGTHTIAPRPFARPALAAKTEAIKQAIADGVAKALK